MWRLITQLETPLRGEAGPLEAQVDVDALRQLVANQAPAPEAKPWSWLFQLPHWLLGAWQKETTDTVRCPYRGSPHVARKSGTPRPKAYLDGDGHLLRAEVYRCYCKNPECAYQAFANLAAGLVLHSVWMLDARLTGLELHMGLGSSYRRVVAALDVAPATRYR